MSRLETRFKALKAENRAAFVAYIQGGDPNVDVSTDILLGLPEAGADIIELGMPFTDPNADGPAIDKAAQRAIKAGANIHKILDMVRTFRRVDTDTPIVLMGYYNPIHHYGVDAFCKEAASAGVDGMIIVDLPPEEDDELRLPANAAGIDVIRLATPTSDEKRLPKVVSGASGFIYYVAVAGVTGGKSATADDIGDAVKRIRQFTDLPIAVGFGIRTPEQAADVAARANAAVVGTAIVEKIAGGLQTDGSVREDTVKEVLDFTRELADGVKAGRT